MANRTAIDAFQVHGVDPQLLIEKVTRSRIYECQYYKEECFGLSIETLIDKAIKLDHIGGLYGNLKPCPFICLVLKLLQLQPSKEIVLELIKTKEYKYVRALGVFYFRLSASSLDVYRHIEPLLNEYHKLRQRNKDGSYSINTMDQFVDDLLREERVFDTILPRITKRFVFEKNGDLQPRISLLDEEIRQAQVVEEPKKGIKSKKRERSPSPETKEDLSIAEANAMRAKLGLKPLKL